MAVVFDDKSGVKTFRAEMYPAYKATRKEPPEELQVQMDYFAEGRRRPGLAGAHGARASRPTT